MDEEKRATFKCSSRSMTSQDSVSPQRDTEVEPKKWGVCSSIVFDTKRMNWIRTNGDVDKQSIKENSSIKDQEIIENRNASENLNAMRNDDDLRTILLGETSNTALKIPSSMEMSAECLESANIEGNKRCHILESEELMDSGCRTVCQSSAPVKPNLDEILQTATVSSGKATMYAANAELVDSLDFDSNGRDGLFWKMSEFHRRSGKQGLEERFEHLSPTVIAQCSAILQDQECIGCSRIAGSSSDLQPETDIVNKEEAYENSVGTNLPIQDERIDWEMSTLTDSGVTAEKHDSKSDSSQNMKTCTFGAQEIGSENLRSLRKRKAVDYSLTKQKGAFKSEISKARYGECFGYPLSVLFWCKNSLQFFNCTSDMDLSNKRKKDFKKLIKTFTLKENDDLVSLSDVGGVKIKIYEGKPISLHSMSNDAYTVNKSCQNMFTVALSISDQDNFRASKCTDDNEFSCCNLSNTFDTDLMKTAVIRDFDIDSLLQEMNIISVASLHDGDKLGEECKKYGMKKQTNDKPSDLSKADFKLTMEGHPQLTHVSLGIDECDSSKNSENNDFIMYETAAADSTVSSTVSDWNECSDNCLPFNMEPPMTSNVNLGSSNSQKRKLEDKCKDDIYIFAKTDLDDQAYTTVISNLTSDPSIQVQHDFDKQSEPLDLRTTSMSYKCKSDLNCTSHNLKRKQSLSIKTVNVNFAGRRGKSKRSGFTSDIAKQTSPQDAFYDPACAQVKPLIGSSNAIVDEFEEMLPKRVLRNHSHITYFPDKKKQKSNKYDNVAHLTQPKKAEIKDKNMDEDVIPSRSPKKNKVEQRTADTVVHLTVKEQSCLFSDGEIIEVDNEHKLAKFKGRKADDTPKEANVIDHGGSLESVVSETDDNEKQNNVNAALAGLYYAETFKGDGNNLLTDSDSRNVTSNTALSVSKKVETLIDNTILKYKFTGKSSNKDGSHNVNDVGDLYKAAGEWQEDGVMKETTSQDGSAEKSYVVTPSEANTPLGKFSEDCHVRLSNNIETDNEELKKDHQQLKENMVSKVLPVGSVVWGRFSRARWWPAIVVPGRLLKRETRPGRNWIFWLSDNRISQLKNFYIELFTSHYKERTSGMLTSNMKLGILKALKICADRAQIDLSTFESIEEWGHDESTSGFLQQIGEENPTAVFPSDEANALPSFVLEQLGILEKRAFDGDLSVPNMNEVAMEKLNVQIHKEMKRKEEKKQKIVPDSEASDQSVDRCLSCDLPLSDNCQVYQHPLFEGTICSKCKNELMSSFYAIDDDGCCLFCGICGEGGKLFVCEKEACGRAFCFSCVERLAGPHLVHQIKETDPWHCFLCSSYSISTHGGLSPRSDWQLEVVKFFQTDKHYSRNIKQDVALTALIHRTGKSEGLVLETLATCCLPRFQGQPQQLKNLVDQVKSCKLSQLIYRSCGLQLVHQCGHQKCNDLDYLTSERKRKIRVLSLFDGIGTGKVVLDELGLDVEVYYSSEINPDAKLVATYHHCPTHLGDAVQLNRAQLAKLCPIDLVIGGPPCNDLSIVNPLRKGFNGTGMLLLKFVTILKDVEALCKGKNHVFWLLENTGSMLTDFKQIICTLLGMEPAVWDAKYFTGQRRARCFWGNIPGLYSTPEFCKQLEQDRKDLSAALISNCNRKALVPHMRTITTGTNSLTIKNGREELPIEMNGVEDGIWVTELERLFGFKEHYTDVGHLSLSVRHKLLGKSWCVPVIKHLLSPLKQYFALKEP